MSQTSTAGGFESDKDLILRNIILEAMIKIVIQIDTAVDTAVDTGRYSCSLKMGIWLRGMDKM